MKDNKPKDTHVGKGDKLVLNNAPLVILKKNRFK